jgi:hypothetical protein
VLVHLSHGTIANFSRMSVSRPAFEVRRCLALPQIMMCASSGLILFPACQRCLLQDKRCFTVPTSHPLRHVPSDIGQFDASHRGLYASHWIPWLVRWQSKPFKASITRPLVFVRSEVDSSAEIGSRATEGRLYPTSLDASNASPSRVASGTK